MKIASAGTRVLGLRALSTAVAFGLVVSLGQSGSLRPSTARAQPLSSCLVSPAHGSGEYVACPWHGSITRELHFQDALNGASMDSKTVVRIDGASAIENTEVKATLSRTVVCPGRTTGTYEVHSSSSVSAEPIQAISYETREMPDGGTRLALYIQTKPPVRSYIIRACGSAQSGKDVDSALSLQAVYDVPSDIDPASVREMHGSTSDRYGFEFVSLGVDSGESLTRWDLTRDECPAASVPSSPAYGVDRGAGAGEDSGMGSEGGTAPDAGTAPMPNSDARTTTVADGSLQASEGTTLFFDGTSLYILNAQGSITGSLPATSGVEGSVDTSIADTGPIPEGKYVLDGQW